ncbi:PREDICTED: uncharacterized protein LOC106814500 [Priapulus caudatus]|uniref:Uncharacterized protein LOC106814500 n=1 Tax=Priapulus caudatus TaxID=37621 RepID=A0ABM1EQ26_PRICU|nr:PREDICTED: uncharacterized protein LOC106814500 [Priapulus caudatus]
MEDAVSHSSLDSDEYVMVNGEPKLKVSGNGNVDDLERRMQEAILSSNVSCPLGSSDANTGHKAEEEAVMRADEKADTPENANKDAEEKLRLINDPLGERDQGSDANEGFPHEKLF